MACVRRCETSGPKPQTSFRLSDRFEADRAATITQHGTQAQLGLSLDLPLCLRVEVHDVRAGACKGDP